MLKETKNKSMSVGFLDPELMALDTMKFERSYVVDYVWKAIRSLVKKELIMFAHHIGDDWILVVIIQRWGRVLYFYSQRSRRENHTDLKAVLDEAFETYCTAYKISRMPSARPGFECGFYTARHMEVALGLLEVRKLEDFDVMVNPLREDMLKNI